MSLDALKQILEDLPDPSFVEGTTKLAERFAIALPDGDVGALDDKMFVDWLVEHAEDAPFGHNGQTKRDKTVRNAKRLEARGKADIAGFDPASVIGEIESALSPRFHLDAKLEDVIVYPTGGMFARHKDTPRTANLVGTLVVGLPIEHEGGGFEIASGAKPHLVDWSGKPDRNTLKWVALFSDVDHAIKPVKSGSRVTLVYSLSLTDRPRSDPKRDKQLTSLRAAAKSVDIAKGSPLMIACTRHVITDGKQPQPIDSLRGTDREIADTFLDAGFDVAVRACIVGDDQEGAAPSFPDASHIWAITRLKTAIPDQVIAGMDDVVSWTDTAGADEEGDFDATCLGEYVLDFVQRDRWVIRKRAMATAIYDGMYSETGYFGNEGSFGHIYTLAALEVTPGTGKPTAKAPKMIEVPEKAPAKASAKAPTKNTAKKPAAKAAAKPKAKPKAKAKAKSKR